VDPVTDPLLLRKRVNARNRTRTSGSLARNSDLKIKLVTCLSIKITHDWKADIEQTSETSINVYQNTQQHIPRDSNSSWFLSVRTSNLAYVSLRVPLVTSLPNSLVVVPLA
jgi:hypothetical protein